MFDAVMKSIDTMLPDELRGNTVARTYGNLYFDSFSNLDDTRKAVEVCKDSAVGIKDYCEASHTLMKCIFKENPNFFFP